MERHYSSDDTEHDEAQTRAQEPGVRPLDRLICRRCHHTWIRRVVDTLPLRCPRCQSLKWLGTPGKAG